MSLSLQRNSKTLAVMIDHDFRPCGFVFVHARLFLLLCTRGSLIKLLQSLRRQDITTDARVKITRNVRQHLHHYDTGPMPGRSDILL